MLKILYVLTLVSSLSSCKAMQQGSTTKHQETQGVSVAYTVEARLLDDLSGFSIIGSKLSDINLTAIVPEGKIAGVASDVTAVIPRLRITFSALDKAADLQLSCDVFLPLTHLKKEAMTIVDSAVCRSAG